MDIEIGDYVRTENGKINKVINNNYYMIQYLDCEKGLINKRDIVKHSKNIIDIIEVGDIVFIEDFFNYSFIHIFDEAMLEALKEDIKKDVKIKSILTKEQYTQKCYEVER